MKYYFATNRQVFKDETGRESLDISRDGITTTSLRFGSIDSVSGNPDNYELFPATPDAHLHFFSQLHSEMSAVDGGDLLVFIHGFECDWQCAFDNLQDIERLFLPSTSIKHLMEFTWPSKGSLLKYPNDDRIAKTSGQVLGNCFDLLVDFFNTHFSVNSYLPENLKDSLSPAADLEPCNRKIHLICHSMGNYVLQNMMDSLKQTYAGIFEEIILVASDVCNDVFSLGGSFNSLNNICRRIHIYCNRNDKALIISGTTKHFDKRLGNDGPDNINTLPSHIYVIDATDVTILHDNSLKDWFIQHWYYKSVTQVIDDITAVLNGENDEVIKNRQDVALGVKYRIKI